MAQIFLIFILAIIVSGCAHASECLPKPARMGQSYIKSPANYGIAPSSFIIPADGRNVAHGIDVSKYQEDVDFDELKDCGADFVYIRLSAGAKPNNELKYRDHWANTRSFRFLPGPYHSFTFGHGHPLTDFQASGPRHDEATKETLEDAHLQAKLFRTRLIELLALDKLDQKNPGQLGQPYLPAALALTWEPKANLSSTDRTPLAESYRSAVCAWIQDYRTDAHFLNQSVIIFAKASNFVIFSLNKLECLQPGDRFWIQFHGFSGDVPWKTGGKMLDDVISMCGPSNSSRCSMQQYTSFGGFALFDRKSPLDLDRYFGSTKELESTLQRAKKVGGE